MAITYELVFWDQCEEGERLLCTKVHCPFMGTDEKGFTLCTLDPTPRIAADNKCVIEKALDLTIWEMEDDEEAEEEDWVDEEEEDWG